VFVNNYISEDFRAVYISKHNNFKPRKIFIFHNTVWAKNSSGGIRLYSADSEYSQYAWANAVFSELPITNVDDVFENVTDNYESAGNYFINASEDIASIDIYPKDNKLFAEAVDMSLFNEFTDYDLDFNGEKYSTAFRGAYSGMGVNPGWKLGIERRPPVNVNTDIDEQIPTHNLEFSISPNPAANYIEISIPYHENDLPSVIKEVKIYNVLGIEAASSSHLHGVEGSRILVDITHLAPGVYYVRVGSKVLKFLKI